MEKLLRIEEAKKNEIVLAAIEKEMPCVISRRNDVGWQVCKSHLISGDTCVGRLRLAFPHMCQGEAAPEFACGDQVGVTFRRGHKKCMFSTKVIEVDESDGGQIVMEWPDAVQEMQRRVYQRAAPVGRRVHVRFWIGGVAARAQVEESGPGIMTGVLKDLSAGGMRITVSGIDVGMFAEGESIGCAFTPKPRGETIVIDSVFRHVQMEDDGTVSVGVQFVGLETTLAGRNQLADIARVVSDFQRSETHQKRPHLAGRGT